MVKVVGRGPVDLAQQIESLFGLCRLGATGFKFYPNSLGEHLQGFTKAQVLLLHDEVKGITPGAAGPETMPGTGIRKHDEGRSLFSVKGTQALVVAPGLF